MLRSLQLSRSRLARRRVRAPKQHGCRRRRDSLLRFESLEDRRVLATVGLVAGDLIVDDPEAGVDDELRISVMDVAGMRRIVVSDPNNPPMPASAEVTVFGADAVSILESDVTGIIDVTTRIGDDVLTLDMSGLALATAVSYDGGADGFVDALGILGNGTNAIVHRPDAVIPGMGVISVDALQVTFSETERSDIAGGMTATLETPNGADQLTLSNETAIGDVPDGSPVIRVNGTSGGTNIHDVGFFDNTTVVIDTATANDGTDQITVTSADDAHLNTNLTFRLGAGGDQVILNGTMEVTGTATIESTDASVTNNNFGVDIIADTLDVTAASFGAITPVMHIDTAVNSLSVNTSASNGNQFVTEVDDLTALDLDAGAGSIRVNARGSITDDDAAVDVTASALTALTGFEKVSGDGSFVFGEQADPIGTLVASLTVNTSLADGGSQFIAEQSDLTALSLNAGTNDNVWLTARGSMTDTDTAVDVTASQLTAITGFARLLGDGSFVFGGVNAPIGTAVGDLTVDTSSADGGNQYIAEQDDLAGIRVNSGAFDNVRLTAGGSITDNDAVPDATANELIAITGFGRVAGDGSFVFGELTAPISTEVASLVLNTSSADGGDQYAAELDNLTALSLNAGLNDNVRLTARGSITDADTDVDITANELTVITGFERQAGDGSFVFGALLSPIGTSVASLTVNTSSADGGNQYTAEQDDLTALSLNAGLNDNVRVTARGLMADADTAVDITANELTSITGFGRVAGDGSFDFGALLAPIGTLVASLTVNTSAADGGSQFIAEVGDLAALSLNSGVSDRVRLTTRGSIMDADTAVDLAGDEVIVITGFERSAGSFDFGALLAPIGTLVASLTVNTSAADGGNQFIAEVDDLTALSLNSGANDDARLTARGFIVDTDTTVDIAARAATVITGFERVAGDGSFVFGGLLAPIGTSVASLTVNTSLADGGDQFIAELGDLAALSLNAGTNDSIRVTARGSITDSDALVDVFANTLTAVTGFERLAGAGSFALGELANPIGTLVTSLIINTSSADGGNHFVSEQDSLTALSLNAGLGNSTITTGGSIVDPDAVTDVTATTFTAAVVGGITGPAGLTTEITSLDVVSAFAVGCSDVDIRNNAETAGPLTVNRATSAGGCNVRITNAGDTTTGQGIIVAGQVAATGAGASLIFTSNSPITVNANQSVTAAGDVALTASNSAAVGDHVTIGGGAMIQSTAGNITISAGEDITVESGATLVAAAQLILEGDTGSDTGTTIRILGTGLLDSGTGTFIRGMGQSDTVLLQAERLAAGDDVTVDVTGGADNVTLSFGANGLLNAASLIIEAGAAAQTDTLTLDASLDTAARIFSMAYDNNDGSGRFAQIQARSGGNAGGTIDANGIDQYNFAASNGLGANETNVLSVVGAVGQANQVNVGAGTTLEVADINCIHVIGQELGDVINLSTVPGTPASLVDGGAGDDHITGTSGRDVIFGDLGADTINGGLGNDFLLPDHGLDAAGTAFSAISDGDVLDGGAGTATSAISQGNDQVSFIVGDLFVSGATLDVVTWLQASFIFDLAEAEAIIITGALTQPCASFLIATGTHNQ